MWGIVAICRDLSCLRAVVIGALICRLSWARSTIGQESAESVGNLWKGTGKLDNKFEMNFEIQHVYFM